MRDLLVVGACQLLTALLVQATFAAAPTTRTEPIHERPTFYYALAEDDEAQAAHRSTAAQDTVYLYGGPGTTQGKFQDSTGVFPDWQGWESVDLTDIPNRWNLSTFNAENLGGHGPGNHAMWCGVDDPSFVTPPGYGNRWNEILQFSTGPVANPQVGQTVSLDMYFNHESEPTYDYLFVEYDSAGVWVVVDQFDGTNHDGTSFPVPGVIYSEVAAGSIRYSGGDYGGERGDEIRLRIRFKSDQGWSDEDGLHSTVAGAAQVDDISVTWSDGSSFEDFEGEGSFAWQPVKAPFAGDFCKLFPRMSDIDDCRSNFSPQVTFIDNGDTINNWQSSALIPGYAVSTGGQLSPNWSYGVPGGWVVNYTGGVSFGLVGIANAVISPPISWDLPGPEDDGPEWAGLQVSFTWWNHLPSANVMWMEYHLRFSTDGGSTWTNWRNPEDKRYAGGGPLYVNRDHCVNDVVEPNATHVQFQFRARGWSGAMVDATPSPTFDNFALKKYRVSGPSITTDMVRFANDGFPVSGSIDVSTQAARDLLDIPFDMAADIGVLSTVQIIPGDSITASVNPIIPGTIVTDTRMRWVLDRNPLFDDVRAPPARNVDENVDTSTYPGQWTGEVVGLQSTTPSGQPIADVYFYDLPDVDFLYPGDRLRYYVQATDNDGRTSTFPANVSGFLDGAGYDRSFTIRGLPSIHDDQGTQPRILLVNHSGYRGGVPYYEQAFEQNGYVEGVDWDIYTLVRPSATVLSNGIGSAGGHGANADQLQGYEVIFFTSGHRSVHILSDGSNDPNNQKDNSIGVLTQWHDQAADRHMAFFGDGLVTGTFNASVAGQTFLSTIFGVDYLDPDVRDEIEQQKQPVARSVVAQFAQDYIANGGCPGIHSFDSIRPIAPAVRGHGFLDLSGQLYQNIAASVINDRIIGGHRKAVLTFPYGVRKVDDLRTKAPGSRSARAALFQEILDYFGTYLPSGPAVGTDPTSAKPFYDFAQYPNPFNPSMTVEFKLGVASEVSVRIYNLRGERVTELFNGELGIGAHSFVWDGRDGRGSTVASGVYLLEVKGQSFTRVKKVALMK